MFPDKITRAPGIALCEGFGDGTGEDSGGEVKNWLKLYVDRFWGGVGGRPAIDPLNNVDDAAGLSESFCFDVD